MRASRTYLMADRLTGGRLREIVAEHRPIDAPKLSWEEIARELFTEFGVMVSGETLRQWFPDDEAAAS